MKRIFSMNAEQQLIQNWRNLSPNKQQQVLKFVESLNKPKQPKQSDLGQRLRQIRARIVASGEPLLDREKIEQEVINCRGRS